MNSNLFSSSSFTRTLLEAAPHLSRRWFFVAGECAPRLRPRKAENVRLRILQQTRRFAGGRERSGTVQNNSLASQRHISHLASAGRNISVHSRSNLLLSGKAATPSMSKHFSVSRTSDIRAVRSYSTATDQKVLSEDILASEESKRSGQQGEKRKQFFPETSSNIVAYWLLASAASVFGIVVFGGLTRLTESGLSITEWRPVTGSLPPMSDEDWEAEFTKYKSSPEFKVLNSRMNLEEFKSIYWMEWVHRIWGRAVGLTFILPAAYFIARRRVSKSMMYRLSGIAGLIGFQGFIGWWMVKSGLKDDFLSPDRKPGRDVPRVSQYRLAAHLGTAFICYIAMLWNGLSILRTNKLVHTASTDAATAQLFALRNPVLRTFKVSVALLAGLVFTTAMSGALVAGLDAGLIYNEFPYMGLGLSPPRSELFDSFYSHKADHSDLYWRNFLENPSLVQLDHRILATSTFTAVMGLWAYTSFSHNMKSFLPRAAARGVHGVVGFAWLQVILGISTLIYLVPTPLASAHQAGALALLTWTTVLGSRIWYPRYAAQILQKRIAAAGGKGGDLVTKAKYAKEYDYPAIPKVKPQLGPGSGGGEPLQTNMSDVGVAVGSIMLALSPFMMQRVERDEELSVAHAKSKLDQDKMAYLQAQQRPCRQSLRY